MAKFVIETPRGRKVTIEADSPDTAVAGAQKWDLEDHAASEAQRLGVSPDLALRVMDRESHADPAAVSPKGALGPMQLMPGTAKDLGVDPHDPYANITGGVTYLKHQIDHFGGDETKALAAYNAGPGAVEKYGGVPPYAETRGYVDAIQGGEPQPAEVGRSQNGGVTIGVEPPAQGRVQVPTIAKSAKAIPTKSTAADVGDQYLSGLKQTVAQTADSLLSMGPAGGLGRISAGNPFGLPSLLGATGDLLTRTLSRHDPQAQTKAGEYAHVFGAMTPNALAPGTIPQRALSVLLPSLGSQLAGDVAKDHGATPLGEQAARFLGGTLGGVGSGLRVTKPATAEAPMTLPGLKQASDAAWAKVDASGFRFPQKAVDDAVTDIRGIVTEADPELFDKAAKVADSFGRLAASGDLSVSKLNRFISRAGNKLMAPGSDEVSVGGDIIGRLRGLIDDAQDPVLREAKDLYTRYVKTREVTDRIGSAELAQETAGTGGNQNAIRQKLRPLIDPKSPQRIRNLTPDEVKAIRKVTKGTPTQNALRLLTAFDPTAGKLQAMLSTGAAGMSGGHSLLMAPIGMAAKYGERAIGAKNLQNVLNVIGRGGQKTPAPLALSYQPGPLAPFPIPLLLEAGQSRPSPAPQGRR